MSNSLLPKRLLFDTIYIMVQSQALQKYTLFNGLQDDQIGKTIPFMQQEKYEPDTEIIAEGKPNDKLFFLLEGQVAVVKKDIVLARFGEGESFGEMEVLDVIPAAASIKSLSQVTVLSISNKNLREIYKADVGTFSLIIMNLARDLSRRLRKMDEKLASSPVLI